MKKTAYIFLSFVILFLSCRQKPELEIDNSATFAKGADISWLPQMEASGYIFYNTDGEAEDCKILKNHGINSVQFTHLCKPF